MTKRMLIDSSHPEETRVVIIDGNKLDDFEVETSTRKQIKGNIYLAKVIRVEPSLQAAFLDYGAGRHGFLPFNEIHPDYYQIPVADKEELLKSEEAETVPELDVESDAAVEPQMEVEPESEVSIELTENNNNDADDIVVDEIDEVITVTSDYEDLLEIDVEKPKKHSLFKKYKIQEVVKRNQIMLVEVTKEERGNKGVAMTTYLSLPGRYCVLMPNSDREGGVSRKITSSTDRKRLKTIIRELPTTDDMAIIVRTAGKDRNKAEITRDYDYLIKTWNNIREETLNSKAPALIYEEGNLIKRSIRDLYTKDIDEIIVEGENCYRMAKDFMKTITPSHARKVKQYKETDISLFQRYQIENQLENLHNPVAQLDAGGYLVINQTEALVAVDVNSGRATKERNIEDTALKTNLEAADEIARQLRLRNLAGLVVIDFIDMEEPSNNHAIERRMKEALKKDRARIQIGRISGFGLMEISRQRIHSSFLEASYTVCPHCNGKGLVRSIESSSIFMIRMIEEEALRRRASKIIINTPVEVALYILNNKRKNINMIEQRYNIDINVNGDSSLLLSTDYRMDIEKIPQEKTPEKYKEKPKEATQIKPQEKQPEKKEPSQNANNNQEGVKSKNNKNHKRKNFNKNKKKNTFENKEKLEEAEVLAEIKPETENKDIAVAVETETDKKNDRKKSKRGGLRNLRKRYNNKYKDRKEHNNTDVKTENNDNTSSVVLFSSHSKNEHYEAPKPSAVVRDNVNNIDRDAAPKKGWWQKLMS